ncbi:MULTISPECIES: hypothetical protein [unclassified Pseudonocardia]|uniref:hypothetical protein n=1 Tax=unclassified Pseudonocardia TaxID=2619320 RepID=UPI00111546DC|nr:hypothetical protein [Pseudonocardia sp. Ae707_Ps1]
MDHSRRPSGRRTALLTLVTTTLVAALVVAGTLPMDRASQVPAGTAVETTLVTTASTAVPTVFEAIPAPPLPPRVIPEFPLPVPEIETADDTTDRCDDPGWWQSRQTGDPGDYVAACGTWPSWVERGDTECLPGEQGCSPAGLDDGTGAAPYLGPTVGRAWSPEYGYFEGRTDGPKNSDGEPCMQGRDNDDPNC